MGVVYDCALCGVCEYDHEGAPHAFRYPEEHEARLSGLKDAAKLLTQVDTLDHARWVLKQWIEMEQDKACFEWKLRA